MRLHLKKWGNSLGIRLPKVFAMQMGIQNDSEIDMEIRDNTIVISHPKESLEAMLRRITPDILHGETDMGDPVGKEIW